MYEFHTLLSPTERMDSDCLIGHGATSKNMGAIQAYVSWKACKETVCNNLLSEPF